MQGEFFSTGSTVQAVIREAIQNSLDAKDLSVEGPVRIAIHVSGQEGAISPRRMDYYLEGAWEHFRAKGNGLLERPTQEESCRFLTLEDFGTTGLTGDVQQYHAIETMANPFYFFFRAEGQSGKGRTDRGRWGIGKYAFPRASRIRSFFALTVRGDDHQRYLVGQAILKSHMVNGLAYTPDGWFGRKGRSGLPIPFEDAATIERFRSDFCVRRNREPGLSLVVPYCDNEITKNAVVEAVVRDYFYAIITRTLCVTIRDSKSETVVESGSLMPIVRELRSDVMGELAPLIQLAIWARERHDSDFLVLSRPPGSGALKWAKELMPGEKLPELRKGLEAQERLAFRVPLSIREKGCEDKESYFDVYLRRDPVAESGRPVFIREGIIISRVRARRTRGIRALVVAQDEGIAGLLGDSENPAHNEWRPDSEKFRGKYTYGPSYLRFVTDSVSEIMNIIEEDTAEPDVTILADIFSIPTPDGMKLPRRRVQSKGGKKPEETVDLPPAPRKRYRIHRVQGGFSVTPGDLATTLPKRLDIRVFYDRRGGKPKYSSSDFRLDRPPITIEHANARKVHCAENRVTFKLLDREFRISITGFDEKRDLFVKAMAKGDDDDAS